MFPHLRVQAFQNASYHNKWEFDSAGGVWKVKYRRQARKQDLRKLPVIEKWANKALSVPAGKTGHDIRLSGRHCTVFEEPPKRGPKRAAAAGCSKLYHFWCVAH